MLHERHLGHQIGGVDHLGLGVASGLTITWRVAPSPLGDRAQHPIRRKVTVTQNDVELVKAKSCRATRR